MTKRHAVALRAFTHADATFTEKQVILSMDAGQFRDWSAPGVDLVREATDAEVARAKGEPAKEAAKPKPPRKPKPSTAKAAPAAEPVAMPDPAPAAPDAA
jgi:hypothetical protein